MRRFTKSESPADLGGQSGFYADSRNLSGLQVSKENRCRRHVSPRSPEFQLRCCEPSQASAIYAPVEALWSVLGSSTYGPLDSLVALFPPPRFVAQHFFPLSTRCKTRL